MYTIKNYIDETLWLHIQRSYLGKNYKNAILDSIQFLTEVIREKSNLDNDGHSLIGQAFKKNNPKIKLNAGKTETEKNIQEGIPNILRGLYSAYRNPRSHSLSEDSKQEAFEIIIFLNHLLKIIQKSKGEFSVKRFLINVFDENFVPDLRYAELLVKDIPKNKSFEVAMELLKSEQDGKTKNLELIWSFLKKRLSPEELTEIHELVSEELLNVEVTHHIVKYVTLFSNVWESIDEKARLRAEHILIKEVYKSETYEDNSNNKEAGSAVSLLKIISRSLLKERIAQSLFDSLKSNNLNRQRFVIYNFPHLIYPLENELLFDSFIEIIKKELNHGNRLIFDWVSYYFEGSAEIKDFQQEIDNFQEVPDDYPF